jgi:hypothetical protein
LLSGITRLWALIASVVEIFTLLQMRGKQSHSQTPAFNGGRFLIGTGRRVQARRLDSGIVRLLNIPHFVSLAVETLAIKLTTTPALIKDWPGVKEDL